MPAWKREILERRKAKGGGSGGAGAAAETSPGGAAPQRVNGETTGSVNGNSGGGADGGGASGGGGGSGRNYTITPANQHYTHNKETRPAAAEDRTTPGQDDGEESLVLQQSLGPLEENPFIKLEKERRRRQDRDSAARPVQHILELYGSVPGVRTIRAENIIIIESDPDYFPDAGELKAGSKWQQNGVSGYSSLNDLLDQRGSAVTEIRAKEVVIYDTTLSKSEENLSTLGRPDHAAPSYETGEGQGRVSRMLQKFDSNYGKLQKKSHSTENLLELDCGASSMRPRLWPKPQPDLVPKPWPGQSPSGPGSSSSHPPSPVFQGPWSSKPKPQSAAFEPGSPQRATEPPQPVYSFRHRFDDSGGRGGAVALAPRDEPDRGPTKPTRERDWEGAEVPPKPKVPCSPETRRARAESPSSPISSKVARSSPDFEIRPSPRPDLNRIPDGDTQALALANLRLQSRNSFTVIPKPRSHLAPSSPPPPTEWQRCPCQECQPPMPRHPLCHPQRGGGEKEQEEKDLVIRSSKPEPSPTVATSPSPPPPSEPSKKGNTFTVVPKRRADNEAQSSSPEPQQEASTEAPPGSTPPQAPYAQLGSLLKKRYPAVEEIEVIGGYLALARSCLSKMGSTGKKLTISFNESSLHSTYEYPSESSAWDSGDDDDDDDERRDGADERPSMVGRIHIPRPSFTGSPTHNSNSNGEMERNDSSYFST
uniref:Taperin n=1 Tax=Scophthalmus maximus TaxID=52904 RepID=A0A8D3ATU4_SCOMX